MAKDTYETHDEMEAPRDGLGNGLVIVTFVILLAAVIIIQKAMGEKYGAGMFKGDKPASTK